jgi:hypothetical protein
LIPVFSMGLGYAAYHYRLLHIIQAAHAEKSVDTAVNMLFYVTAAVVILKVVLVLRRPRQEP